jgi:hypothetical protein
MDRNALWALFEKTGNIGAYMLYRDNGADSASNNQGAATNADKDRRPDYTGYQCR